MKPPHSGQPMVIGRAVESAVVEDFLGDPTSAALVVRGDPGSGRTTLIADALRRTNGEIDVIRCSGRIAGAGGPYSALLASVDGVRQHVVWGQWAEAMARTVRQHARAAADADGAADPTELLNELATVTHGVGRMQTPTVVVVEDLDAADPLTQRFVAIAADRASALPWSYLVTTAGEPPLAAHHPVIELDGLDDVAVRELLERLTGHRIPMPVAEAIRRRTGGMPLAVLAVAGLLTSEVLRGLEPLPVPLPPSERLIAAYRPRYAGLDPTTVAALAMFSCRDAIALGPFAVVVGGIGTVEELISRGLARVHGGIVRPTSRTQPAVAWSRSALSVLSSVAGLLAAESAGDERLIFQLVDHASKPEEWAEELTVRLRTTADDQVASVLAPLSEYRLDGSTDVAYLRALALAYEGLGATTAAERILDRLQRQRPSGADLLTLHMCRARIGGLAGFSPADASSWEEPDEGQAPNVDTRIALAAMHTFQDQADRARAELEHASADRDATSAEGRRRAELTELAKRLRSGEPVDFEAYRTAIESQVRDGLWDSWIYIVAFVRDLLAMSDPRAARGLLKERLATPLPAVERCAYVAASAEVELWEGQYGRALELIREVDQRLPSAAVEGLNVRSTLLRCHASTGEGAELLARYDAEPLVGVGRVQIYTRAVSVGYAHLVAGEYRDAAGMLAVVMRNSYAVPHLVPECLANLVEALVAAGDVDGARCERERGRELMLETSSVRSRFLLRRCEVLTQVPNPTGEPYPVDDPDLVDDAARARSLVAEARGLIRAGRVADARTRLDRAEQMVRLWGLEGWLPEIERLRSSEVGVAGPWGDLSDDERRIVAMVVDGARNRDIATEMFVSLRTAEAALTRIFRTVGVTNRGELIALASRSGIGLAASH